MQRRELLKDLSILAGGALWANSAWAAFITDEKPSSPVSFASPIRGLVRKNGKLLQPVQLTIRHDGTDTTAITKLNGREIDRRVIPSGSHVFRVLTPAVSAPQQVEVECEVDGKTTLGSVELRTVRRVQVYILRHSHHDLGYTDLQATVEDQQIRNISIGMDVARRTAGYPEGARFVWNLEVLWGADLFLRRKSQEEKAALIEAVRNGWVSLNGMYANELTGLCRPEELLQLFRFSRELGRECGVSVDSAMLSDVPGFTWGMATAMSQAGIRYFSAAPSLFDRIGTIMAEWQEKPFWWVSPSGNEKVLVWVPWTGYAMSHVMKVGPEWVGTYQDRLDAVNFAYDISYIRWSGHATTPNPTLRFASS